MNKVYVYYALYTIGIIFTLSGAVNAGLSLYFMAIPFMALMIWISKFKLKNKSLFYFSIALIIFSIGVSHTQTRNPILFPIISDGYIEILENGYQLTFSDGSGGFSLDNKEDIACIGCGEVIYTEVKKGEKFKVLAVRVEHPDFTTSITLVTEIGEFTEHDYRPWGGEERAIGVNKPVRAKWAENLSGLMAWPILPLSLL